MTTTTTADVAILGAGLSGLTAALRLQQQGRSVVVLEADARVGGRTVNLDVADGVTTEGGGQWIGTRHTRVLALLEELGLSTFDTHTEGDTLYLRRGRRRRFAGTIPPMSPLAVLDFAQAQVRLERMARAVPEASPWDAPRAVRWDATTLGSWLDTHCRVSESRHLFTLGFTLIFCEDPHRISLLKALHQIRTSGGIDFMMNTTDGAQEMRVVGGSALMATRIADRLADRVVLGSPVETIEQGGEEVRIRSARADVRCDRVIVAMSPADADRIAFAPALPTARAALQRVWHNGTESKVFAVYPRPFWRDQGLNGSALTDLPTVHHVVDNSPPDGEVGILLAFIGTASSGPGLTWPEEVLDDRDVRHEALVADLVTLFGPEAGHPVEVLEQSWVGQPWISGCVGTRAPGVMTSYTDAVTAPVGRIHWAGTEAAPLFESYMEGAIRAGERAAEQVTALLTSPHASLAGDP